MDDGDESEMKLKDAVEALRKARAKTVVVVGPPRSGTRIITKIIASELGFEYVDEKAFGMIQWKQFVDVAKVKTVVQAPALTEFAADMPPYMSVVFVMRDNDEIRRSRKRIKWQGEERERKRIGSRHGELDISDDVLEYTKTLWLDLLQPYLRDRGLTVDYASAAEYDAFIPKSERGDFTWWQTEKS